MYRILQLRQEVFIIEQNCPYLDADGIDDQCHHVLGKIDNEIVAYSRIVPKDISYEGYIAIGRVATSKSLRSKSLGKEIFKYTLDLCSEMFPTEKIKLSSQVYIKKFYEAFGFQEYGEVYLEDDIPHIPMILDHH